MEKAKYEILVKLTEDIKTLLDTIDEEIEFINEVIGKIEEMLDEE